MATVVDEPHPKLGYVEPGSEKFPERSSAKRARRQDNTFAYLFLAPQLLGLLVFMLGPLIFAFALSLSNWDGFGTRSFAGFKNFSTVLSDPQFRESTVNTIWYAVLSVPGTMIAAFIVAYMLQKVRTKSLYRAFYFAPVVTSTVAVAAIWLWLFNPEISPLNNLLRNVGLPAPDWLQDARFVIPAFAIVGIWQGLGYQIVMMMAGLENVPKSLIEAADIDGASELQKMRRITIPLLSPTILFLSITSIIGSFQIFDYIYVFMGPSAPAASRTIVYEIFQRAFVEFNFGLGSAIAILLFLGLLALTGLQLMAQKRWVHYTE
ncbi:MAG TPA: sugar ABC transporter permease [Propionibacteriaceae bacterium]|nr:sugar ABC transporter permease [Propionibacteriaceae bacterium]